MAVPELPTQRQPSFYDRYIRPRYHSDECFRRKLIARATAYNAAAKDDPLFKARKREAARRCYWRRKQQGALQHTGAAGSAGKGNTGGLTNPNLCLWCTAVATKINGVLTIINCKHKQCPVPACEKKWTVAATGYNNRMSASNGIKKAQQEQQ